jgi:hypothetical protein
MLDDSNPQAGALAKRAAPVSVLSRRPVRFAAQASVLFALDQAYEAGRGIIPHQQAVALKNGLAVVKIEKRLHIFTEWHVQSIVFRRKVWDVGPLTVYQHAIISVINHFYLYSHFLFTPLFLVGLYFWNKRVFPFVRDVFMIATALALAIYIIFPMMPPRLMGSQMNVPHGYRIQDTLAPILNYKLQQSQFGYNPYASMPSLHFAWALILGVTLVVIGGHLLVRVLGALYPVLMLATIVISGNHLWLDAAGAVAVDVIAACLALAWRRRLNAARSSRRVPEAGLSPASSA